jgi:hypothetical protein
MKTKKGQLFEMKMSFNPTMGLFVLLILANIFMGILIILKEVVLR